MIVIEGPDNAGKSVLASRLSEHFSLPVQASEGPPKHPGELNARLMRYSSLSLTIFDRHPIVSQPIYCKLRGGDPEFDVTLWTKWLYDRKPIFIYCDPGLRTLDGHNVKEHDTKEHLAQISEGQTYLLTAYREWAINHATFVYRIGDNVERLIRAVEAAWLDAAAPNMCADIFAFHQKFSLDYEGHVRDLPSDIAEFRKLFMAEELREYETADQETDFVKRNAQRLDALVDLCYVALGTAHLHGFDFNEGWRRVHRANMTKVRAKRIDHSMRKSLWDVIKPPGFIPPDHTDLIV